MQDNRQIRASLIEITGVELPQQGDEAPYFRGTKDEGRGTREVLHIGWMSMNPINVVKGKTVMLIRGRIVNGAVETGFKPVSTNATIRFTLNENPLCKLADADGNVIDDATLVIADAGHPSPVTRIWCRFTLTRQRMCCTSNTWWSRKGCSKRSW